MWGSGARSLKQRLSKAARKFIGWQLNHFEKLGIYYYVAALAATVGLGLYGFNRYYSLKGIDESWLDILYQTIHLFLMKSDQIAWSGGVYVLTLDIARWTGTFVFLWTAITIMSRAFKEPMKNLQLRMCTDHIIICGTGRIGSRFARSLKDEQLVVIEKDLNCPFLRELEASNAIIIKGDANDEKVLKRAKVERAKCIIPALGSDDLNANIAFHVGELMENRRGDPLTCYVHVCDESLRKILRAQEYTSKRKNVRLEFYNLWDQGARVVLDKFSPYLNKKDDAWHIVIIGLGMMGEALLTESAKICMGSRNQQNKIDVTVVDREADRKVDQLKALHPSIERTFNLRCITAEIDTKNISSLECIKKGLSGPFPDPSTIYVCLPDDTDSLSFATKLGNSFPRVPIVVRLNAIDGLTQLLNRKGKIAEYENIFTFGLWDLTCTKGLIKNGTSELLAERIHEEYFSDHLNDPECKKKEAARSHWNELPEHFKNANRAQADHVDVKAMTIACRIAPLNDREVETFNFTPYEIDRLARIEHQRWCDYMTRIGWKYSKPSNGSKPDRRKTHQYLVPWEKLDGTRKNDFEAVVNMPRNLAKIDLRIERKNISLMLAQAIYLNEKKVDLKNFTLEYSWEMLLEKEKEAYLERADLIKRSLEAAGCGLSGRGPDQQKSWHFSPEELSTIRSGRAYHKLDSEIERWPEMLLRNDISIFRKKEEMAKMEYDNDMLQEYFDNERLKNPF